MAEISGGAGLERYLADLGKRYSEKLTLKVGFLAGATYPDGTPVALVAAAQNYGAPSRGIPPRPFMSNWIETKQHEWGPALAAELEKGTDARTAMEKLGEGMVGQLRQSIVDTNDPPLAESTAKAKGFDTPLVHTGHMLNSADYKVE